MIQKLAWVCFYFYLRNGHEHLSTLALCRRQLSWLAEVVLRRRVRSFNLTSIAVSRLRTRRNAQQMSVC